MFKVQTISLAILWGLSAFAYFEFALTPSENDKIAYQRLMALTENNKQSKEEDCPTRQIRHQISKQILYNKDCNRVQSRLYSDQSELVYHWQNGKGELTEQCNGFICAMPEQVIHPSQNWEEDESMKINSGEASYDGKSISLSGDVSVQHSLGQIIAHHVKFGKDKKKYSVLEISDNVTVDLKDGGQLQCQQAKIDYIRMEGLFLGNSEKPDVVYQESSLEVKSPQMTLELVRETQFSSSRTLVKQIEAIQNVRALYNQNYTLEADHALYQRLPTSDGVQAGILTLSPQKNLFCRMTNLNGDSLLAKTIQVDTNERKIQFAKPEGKLLISKEGPQIFEFKAKELIWEDPKQILFLKDDVEILQNGTFGLNTPKEISLTLDNINGKRILRLIQSPENTQISYLSSSQKDTPHKINCPGPLQIDHEKFLMILQGNLQQVYIEDMLGDMYADNVQVHYHWEENHIQPEKIILEGNVRLLNRFDGHLQESGSILHYALADRVEVFPKKQEIILHSSKGNRVLFFDKVNNVQMSAPSLKLSRDMISKKEMIQGEGDVRFTFIEKELAQIKELFKSTDSEGVKNAK